MNLAIMNFWLQGTVPRSHASEPTAAVCLCNTTYDTYQPVLKYRVRLFHPIYNTEVSTAERYYFKTQLTSSRQ